MDRATARRLTALNRCFYRRFAAPFAATRGAPWPGWRRLVARVRPPAEGGALRVLDVGCGNGRFAAFCAATFPFPVDYIGVDGSSTMLALARERGGGLARARWLRCTLGADADQRLPGGPFHLVVLLGVLHHLPGAAARRQVLRAAAARLAPGGVLAFTLWRLFSMPRLAERVVAWEEFNRSLRRPLDLRQLEPGDVLLSFGGHKNAVRYCHGVSDGELAEWLGQLPPVIDDYLADGASGDLNRYLLLGDLSAPRRS